MSNAPGAWRAIEVQRVRDGQRSVAEDRAATEAPLEIRLHGQPFVMTMRTPGADRDLATGFLLAEQVIGGRRRHRHVDCTRPTTNRRST